MIYEEYVKISVFYISRLYFSYFYIDNHNSYGCSFLRDFFVRSFVFCLPMLLANDNVTCGSV